MPAPRDPIEAVLDAAVPHAFGIATRTAPLAEIASAREAEGNEHMVLTVA